MVAILDEFNSDIDALEQALGIDAAEHEAAFVKSFGALGASADAHGGEWMAHAGEEAGLFRESAAVANYSKGIHLEAVVVVEAQGFVLDDTSIELESTGLKAFAATGMTTVEDGHVVLLGHLIDGIEEAQEVFLRVNVLFSMGTQQNILALLKSEFFVDS